MAHWIAVSNTSLVQVKTTSSAVRGDPSLNFRPGRRWKSKTLPEESTVQLSAKPGLGRPVWASASTRPEKISPTKSLEEDSFSTMGLNVLGPPSEARTSFPPGVPISRERASPVTPVFLSVEWQEERKAVARRASGVLLMGPER